MSYQSLAPAAVSNTIGSTCSAPPAPRVQYGMKRPVASYSGALPAYSASLPSRAFGSHVTAVPTRSSDPVSGALTSSLICSRASGRLAVRVPRMAPARLTMAARLVAMRACSTPDTSRLDVRARSIAAASALALLRMPVTVAVIATLATTSAVAAAQILPLRERFMGGPCKENQKVRNSATTNVPLAGSDVSITPAPLGTPVV